DHLIAFDAARARVDRVGADGGEVVELEGQDLAFPVAGYADFRLVLARVDVGQERFQAVGYEFHGAAQHDRQRGGRHLVRVYVDLDAVRAPDVLCDDPDAAFGYVEVPRENILHHVRRLSRVIHGKRVLGRVVVRDQRAALERHPGVAPECHGFFDHHVGPGESRVDCAGIELAPEADVVAQLGMDHTAA